MLSHSGELLQTHGRSWRKATNDDITGQTSLGEPVDAPGVLFGPLLCQVDDEGSALMADWGNQRLQVMRADGAWSVVDLDQAVGGPQGAVWCSPSLYVVNNGIFVKYSAT